MKHPVKIAIQSHQMDAEGHEQTSLDEYRGTWHRHNGQSYLIYQDREGLQTTLKIDAEGHEWRLYRRSPQMEAWQVFRLGESTNTDLVVHGGMLPIHTYTKRLWSMTTDDGGELQMEYNLYSDEQDRTLLGNFCLIIHLTYEDTHG